MDISKHSLIFCNKMLSMVVHILCESRRRLSGSGRDSLSMTNDNFCLRRKGL
jgi:hypothetical protein